MGLHDSGSRGEGVGICEDTEHVQADVMLLNLVTLLEGFLTPNLPHFK